MAPGIFPFHGSRETFLSQSLRCAKVVNAADPLAGLDADLAAGTLPQYSFYTPDINNDGHDTGELDSPS
jgi:hypothetical protein